MLLTDGEETIHVIEPMEAAEVASELGMSGDGNDEEIVKLSIEGKVMMITIITMMMMMIMIMMIIMILTLENLYL